MAQTILGRNQILESVSFAAKQFLSDGDHDKIVGEVLERVGQAAGASRACVLQQQLTRVFAHGFTTKRDGHGFGLHAGALAAKQMNGSLTAESDGPGRGANFILELPLSGVLERSAR
jgi:chemotaxis protein histidine kinase CheA